MTSLDERLAEIAAVPILLVATDYDGTIAPIVDEPSQAQPLREAIIALRLLAGLPQTHVAVISGRALADLASLTGPPEDVHLVGSHGSEFDLNYATALAKPAVALRDRVAKELAEIAGSASGLTVEEKPAGVALHYRKAHPEDAKRVLSAVQNGPATIEGVCTRHGKKVVELSVVGTNKGDALETVRHRCGASAAVFLGDDRTDEDAFARLRGPDLAIKVGAGKSMAPFRIDGPEEAARILARLGELRAHWLEGAQATAIENHSLLSDQRSVALATGTGRITWMCAPRADSPPIFAEIIGGPSAGHFTIEPAETNEQPHQHYDDSTLILKTRWPSLLVTDWFDCSVGRPHQRPGRSDLVRMIEGDAPVLITFAPRLDFGRIETQLRARDGGLEVDGTHDPIVLRSPGIEWTISREGQHQTATARVTPKSGEPIILELRYGSGRLRDDRTRVPERLQLTHRFWSDWSERLQLPPEQHEIVLRSALTLKALCHGPTGAVLAAATTSLPEHIGGIRNWDYRYCWVRDAAMSAAALVRLGSRQEAMSFLNWMCAVVDACESPERLHPLYTIAGHELGTEAEITELSGYLGSRPVRVGNAAARQVQLDVFGPIVELVAMLIEAEAPVSNDHWRLVEAMVTAVTRRWDAPDHGVWEIRRSRRHHVHSKVMCWLTVDRAIAIADQLLERDMPEWRELRDRIAADVLEHGYKPDVGAFTAAYDDSDPDAAALSVGLSGLLPPTDERFRSTIDVVERSLKHGPTMYRYRADDGLPGFEGGFHICMGWFIQSLIRVGRRDEAIKYFDQLCELAGPTGMLSEQYDPKTKRALGNTPQAYSHLALINIAMDLRMDWPSS